MQQEQEKNGKQLIKLRLALSKALDSTMSNCSHEKFSAAFPSLTRDHPHALKQPRDSIIEYLKANCKEEFEAILNRREIPDKLNALDTLKEQESQEFQPIDAVEAKSSHLKQQELAALDATLEYYESDNSKWMETVTSKQNEIKDLKNKIEEFCNIHLARSCTQDLESCL